MTERQRGAWIKAHYAQRREGFDGGMLECLNSYADLIEGMSKEKLQQTPETFFFYLTVVEMITRNPAISAWWIEGTLPGSGLTLETVLACGFFQNDPEEYLMGRVNRGSIDGKQHARLIEAGTKVSKAIREMDAIVAETIRDDIERFKEDATTGKYTPADA